MNAQQNLDAVIKALEKAIEAATHVIRVCEADLEAGVSPNPFVRSCPSAALAECYGAMNFIGEARQALTLWKADSIPCAIITKKKSRRKSKVSV